jgi:predicted Zn-dependent protease
MERALGERWQRMFRSQVPTSSDPLIIDYLQKLLSELAETSQLTDQRLSLIVAKNASMNAFAVPGGVVGVHTGLFLFADNEHQLASVLSHELAHLSQRHFARGVEAQQKASIPAMAGLLGALVLAATVGGDAGIAAMTASQAVSMENSLRFSRQNEQEADRIGMVNMVKAGMDPNAVPEMFEGMMQSTRYTRRPPEFLLSHPVTEKRIADSRGRAAQYPDKQYQNNLDYFLMQARIQLEHAVTPQAAVKRFRNEIDGETLSQEGSRYGLVLALTASNETDAAWEALKPLLEKSPKKITYQIAAVDIFVADRQYDSALTLLERELKLYPDNHPLNVRYAETLMKAGRYALAENTLNEYSRKRPKDDYVWYLLAEVHGLAGNILGVHQARAEYFILNGVYDKAQSQLRNALKLSRSSYHTSALLQERIKDVRSMQENDHL